MIVLEPKAKFLKSDHAKFFADLVLNPGFQNALAVALSELQLHPPKEGTTAADNWNRLEGAKDYIRILINLAEPPDKPRRGVPRENLQPTT